MLSGYYIYACSGIVGSIGKPNTPELHALIKSSGAEKCFKSRISASSSRLIIITSKSVASPTELKEVQAVPTKKGVVFIAWEDFLNILTTQTFDPSDWKQKNGNTGTTKASPITSFAKKVNVKFSSSPEKENYNKKSTADKSRTFLSPSTKQNKVSVARSHSPDNEPTANEPRTNISPRRKAIGIINGFGFNVPFAKKGVSVQDDAKLEEVVFKKKEGTETLVWKTKLDKSPVRALNVSSVGVS